MFTNRLSPTDLAITAAARRIRSAPIAAWGDSLTAGSGASNPSTKSYPAVASDLFFPARRFANLGVSSQTSTQIAARQGAIPIAVSVAGGSLPAQTGWSYDFHSGPNGFATRQAATVPASVVADTSPGQLVVTGSGSASSGAQVYLGQTLTNGTQWLLEFDMELGGLPYVEGGLVRSGSASSYDGSYGAYFYTNTSGRKSTVLTVGTFGPETTVNSLLFMVNANLGTPRISNVILREVVAGLPVPTKSVNILYRSGVFQDSAAGSIAGVEGMMTTDATGNWTFTRQQAGPAVAVPDGTAFVPQTATLHGNKTAWIWAGRNNFTNPAAVKSDIAAMIARLGHSRYLIAEILPMAGDTAPNLATLTTLNADLAATYGQRFVPLLAPLQAAGDGSVNDIADIAAGLVPRSLRVDGIHLKDAGYAIVAQQMRLRAAG